MNQQALQAYKDLFSGSPEPVVIYDENWQVVWKNSDFSAEMLHKQLMLRNDCWVNLSRCVGIDGGYYLCRLSCSVENGLRTAQFAPMGRSCGYESQTVAGIVRGISTLCEQLCRDLEHYDLQDEYPLLNAISGNNLLLYRMNLLQNELERARAGAFEPLTLNLWQLAAAVCHSVKSILRQVMLFELLPDQEPLFVYADPSILREMLVLCVLLSVGEPDHLSQTQVKLLREEDRAVFTVSTQMLAEERSDLRTQVRHPGSTDAEQELIDLFCKEYDAAFLRSTQDGLTTVRLELPLREPGKILGLASSLDVGNPPFYDTVSALLAPLRYRNQF